MNIAHGLKHHPRFCVSVTLSEVALFLWFTSKFSSMQKVQGFIQIAVI